MIKGMLYPSSPREYTAHVARLRAVEYSAHDAHHDAGIIDYSRSFIKYPAAPIPESRCWIDDAGKRTRVGLGIYNGSNDIMRDGLTLCTIRYIGVYRTSMPRR